MQNNQKFIKEYEKRADELKVLEKENQQKYNEECNRLCKLQQDCQEHNTIEYNTTTLTMENNDTPIGKVVWMICINCLGLFSKRYSFKSECPFCKIPLLINEENTNDQQVDFRCENCNYQQIIIR